MKDDTSEEKGILYWTKWGAFGLFVFGLVALFNSQPFAALQDYQKDTLYSVLFTLIVFIYFQFFREYKVKMVNEKESKEKTPKKKETS